MGPAAQPVLKDIVLVGGGHSHVQVLKSFGMRPVPGVRLTLISREIETLYSGMLPGLVAGHYTFEQCHIDLAPLASFAGARLIRAEANGLDREAKRVLLAGRPAVAYDLVSFDIGITPALAAIPGAEAWATLVKPIGRFLERWRRIEARVPEHRGVFGLVVIGSGAGGVELLLAARHRLRALLETAGRDPETLRCRLIGRGGLLPTCNDAVRATFARVLAERGVECLLDDGAHAIEPDRVICAGGHSVSADAILVVTEAEGAAWLTETGLPLARRGFVAVDATLRSPADWSVFATGDTAEMLSSPRPKAGVFAVRQGPPLAANLRRVALGRVPWPFHPQRAFLSLISTGNRYAVASRGRLKLEGRWCWTLKDWIDRRWMRRYQELPQTPAPELPAGARALADGVALAVLREAPMRWGGCGAKVGAAVIERVLRDLPSQPSADLVLGLDAPDDPAVIRVPPGLVSVQTIDYFRAFLDDPFLLGRIAAVHALNDIFAMGAEPRTALALATVPFGPEAKVEEALRQLLLGALAAFGPEQVALAGGHSSEGAELSLGFAVYGVAEPARLLRKGGLRIGQELVLTRPLGTGVILAAAMRARSRGAWLEDALDQMQRSGRQAAAVLRAHGATASTDVSGFGLIGHLVEMLRASGLAARLDPDAVPALAGARELLAAGIASSLQPENLRLRRALSGAADKPSTALLFDPQTAGGLLAGVPADRADACVTALRAAGEPAAAIIGEIVPAGEDGALVALDRLPRTSRPTPVTA